MITSTFQPILRRAFPRRNRTARADAPKARPWFPLIVDHRPSYLRSGPQTVSLLTQLFGSGSLIGHLANRMADFVEGDLLIMPTFRCEPDYERRIRGSVSVPVRFVRHESLSAFVDECEPSDYLLVVDPARWPINGFDLRAAIRRLHGYAGATHAVAVGADAERTRERVECDGNGRVKRVQRFYNGITWTETGEAAVFLSLLPARAIGDIRFGSLGGLRSAVSAKGVLSRDVPIAVDLADLTEERGWLALNEAVLLRAVRELPRSGASIKRTGVWAGRGCRIDPSARLVGPVVLHDEVTLEEGATIIGPAVVGRGGRICRGAIVAQSVLAPGTVVPAGAAIRQRVVYGRSSCSASASTCADGPDGFDEAELATATGPPRRRVHLGLKRAMDVVLSLAALLLLSPLLLVVAALIKLGSPGRVLFTHRREQKGGKEFPCLKFRTMVAGAHGRQRELYKHSEVDGPQFKIRDDPRLTPFGQWLRATNIDELPQLINVLLGQMSLVGPRPSPFRENQICVPWRRARLSVRPGITGLWQLCRRPSEAGFHEWIFYDLAYVRHFSIWLDIKVLFATAWTLGGRRRVPLRWFVRSDGTEERRRLVQPLGT